MDRIKASQVCFPSRFHRHRQCLQHLACVSQHCTGLSQMRIFAVPVTQQRGIWSGTNEIGNRSNSTSSRTTSSSGSSRCSAGHQPEEVIPHHTTQLHSPVIEQHKGMTDALHDGLRVVIDCSWTSSTSTTSSRQHQHHARSLAHPNTARQQRELISGTFIPKDVRSLAKQIELCAAINKRSKRPVALTVTSYTGPLKAFAEHMGAAAWPISTHHQPLLESFNPNDLILLSPDAEAPLTSLDPSKVYVVGGIVDKTVQKGMTAGFAVRHGLSVYRLPVKEHAEQLGLGFPGASTRPVLSVTDVVTALIEYNRTRDWIVALDAALPSRKRRQHGAWSSGGTTRNTPLSRR